MAKNENLEKILGTTADLLDYDTINKSLKLLKKDDIGEISKKTIRNIGKWALNGASNLEIANNLELNESQFKTLCSLCPAIMWVMQQSREMADVVLAGSLFQRAVGGQVIRKKVAIKIGDYEDGRKIGEHIEYVVQEEELPPDSNLLKFLAENKLSEKFGEGKVDTDKEVVSVINTLSAEQMKELEKQLREEKDNE